MGYAQEAALNTQQQGQAETPRRFAVLPQGLVPRALSRQQAAAYFGVSASLFDRMVKDKLAPRPAKVYGRVLWDRHKLDLAFAALSDGDADSHETPWDRMAV